MLTAAIQLTHDLGLELVGDLDLAIASRHLIPLVLHLVEIEVWPELDATKKLVVDTHVALARRRRGIG